MIMLVWKPFNRLLLLCAIKSLMIYSSDGEPLALYVF